MLVFPTGYCNLYGYVSQTFDTLDKRSSRDVNIAEFIMWTSRIVVGN